MTSKMINREDYVESKREELRKLEIMVEIIDLLEERRKWEMTPKTDENGNLVKDENDECVRVVPDKADEWCYTRYTAYTDVITLLEKTYFN